MGLSYSWIFKLSRTLACGLVCLSIFHATGGYATDRGKRAEAAISNLISQDGRARPTLEAMQEYGLPGLSVAVIEDYEVSWSGAWGVKAVASADPVDGLTAFNLASMSKPITAILVAILAEKGLLDLDAPVASYLKRWNLPDNEFTRQTEITLAHLLSHTAGTTQHGFDDFYLGGEVPTLVDVLNGTDLAGTEPLDVVFAPGTNWRYSGGGYVIIQMAVEDHLEQPLADLASEHLFEPLAMVHTTMRQHGEDGFPANVALAHDANQEQVGATGLPVCPQLAASGVWSTPLDIAKLIIAMQKGLRGDEGGVISPAVARQTTEIVTSLVMGGWSHGWSRELYYGNREWFWHGGANTGTGGAIYASMEGGVGLIMVGNGPNHIRGPVLTEFRKSTLAAHGWAQPMIMPAEPLTVDEAFATEVRGRYQTRWGGAIVVSEVGGGLVMDGFSGSGPVKLIQVGDNAFVVDEFASEIRFLTNPDDDKRYMSFMRRGTNTIDYANPALWTPEVMPEEVLLKGDYDASLTAYRQLLSATPTDPAGSENTLNGLGYRELVAGRTQTAVMAFRICTEFYPDSANAHDSLGEGYMTAGETAKAIASYEMSLALDPRNQNAVRMLEKLRTR